MVLEVSELLFVKVVNSWLCQNLSRLYLMCCISDNNPFTGR